MLDRKFRVAQSTKESLFYSKLAILELCGWIEESMDDIVLRCSNRHLRERSNKNYIEKYVVQRTYGFDYEKHFRKMMIHLVGVINVERIEKKVDPIKRDLFKSTLSSLKTMRNAEAHTHLKATTRQINAPSVTLSQLPAVLDGLMEYDRVIRANSF